MCVQTAQSRAGTKRAMFIPGECVSQWCTRIFSPQFYPKKRDLRDATCWRVHERKKIAVLVGSLRKASFNRMTAQSLISLAPVTLKLALIELVGLPLYNEDLEETVPPPLLNFRERIQEVDGIIFVTPEYNRSIPAALKNALDIGSRPMGKSIWNGKPAGVVSVTRGNLGAFGANHHLRQSLVTLNVPTMPHPEVYISNADSLFDPSGKLINAPVHQLLETFVNSFAVWVARNPASQISKKTKAKFPLRISHRNSLNQSLIEAKID